MKRKSRLFLALGGPTVALACSMGCAQNEHLLAAPPAPLGSEIDQINMTQETNAEAAKFIIYAHEFEMNEIRSDGTNAGGVHLNGYGEDHVKQIASNLKRGVMFPVIVERTQSSAKPGTKYHYPVHFNDELDARRRQVVVSSLMLLGVPNAEEVVVAPSFAEGISGFRSGQVVQPVDDRYSRLVRRQWW